MITNTFDADLPVPQANYRGVSKAGVKTAQALKQLGSGVRLLDISFTSIPPDTIFELTMSLPRLEELRIELKSGPRVRKMCMLLDVCLSKHFENGQDTLALHTLHISVTLLVSGLAHSSNLQRLY